MTHNQRLAIFGDLGFAEGVLRGMKMVDRTPTQVTAIDEALSRLDRVLSVFRDEALREPITWQPIETAPKDGTDFLGCWGDDEMHVVSCRDGVFSRAMDGEEWTPPAAWMPLPEPPGQPQD